MVKRVFVRMKTNPRWIQVDVVGPVGANGVHGPVYAPPELRGRQSWQKFAEGCHQRSCRRISAVVWTPEGLTAFRGQEFRRKVRSRGETALGAGELDADGGDLVSPGHGCG